MPANLTPQYHKAEEAYKKATTAEERLACLKQMYTQLPKHKGTEKLQADLKTKMAEAKEAIEQEKKAPKGGVSYKIQSQGAGQVVLLGPPNVGKSLILKRLTKATPEVAAYPFTTREPQPGMMAWEDVFVQLVDLPPITPDYLEAWQGNLIRGADLALLVVGLADDDGATRTLEAVTKLAEIKTHLDTGPTRLSDDGRERFIKTLLVANQADVADADLRLELLRAAVGQRWPLIVVSAETGAGMEELRTAIYQSLGVIRVYTKQPGKPADRTSPFTCPQGSTVIDLAGIIHRDLLASFKSARIWGTGVFDGQTVKRDHVLNDGDIVEIHT
ncbi:MAG TPA: TGS domain-containing protein [Gemmatales bacterium]|nr:TGS domain-containing protein [Gemmatales bacterium]HMP60631.1 TGS domain-containing protein [Gemmatales bacterium]